MNVLQIFFTGGQPYSYRDDNGICTVRHHKENFGKKFDTLYTGDKAGAMKVLNKLFDDNVTFDNKLAKSNMG